MLGLIFLRYADVRFAKVEKELAGKATGRKEIGKADYQAKGIMFLPQTARFSYLKALPRESDFLGRWSESGIISLVSFGGLQECGHRFSSTWTTVPSDHTRHRSCIRPTRPCPHFLGLLEPLGSKAPKQHHDRRPDQKL